MAGVGVCRGGWGKGRWVRMGRGGDCGGGCGLGIGDAKCVVRNRGWDFPQEIVLGKKKTKTPPLWTVL